MSHVRVQHKLIQCIAQNQMLDITKFILIDFTRWLAGFKGAVLIFISLLIWFAHPSRGSHGEKQVSSYITSVVASSSFHVNRANRTILLNIEGFAYSCFNLYTG